MIDVAMNQALRDYVQNRSAEEFRRLVEANVDAVYSQGLRELHDPAAAEEITQTVFIALAQKAHTIRANAVLEGWLFIATRYHCANYKRAAGRRRQAERKATIMRSEIIPSGPVDDDLQIRTEGMLDDALGNLNERDRNAVLLRFFHGRSLREVGEAQGVSEDAAKRRVLRAVEKLRNYFSRKGVNVPSVALIELMGRAVKPAAPHVAQSAIHAGLAKSALANAGWMSHATLTWQNIAAAVAVVGVVIGASVMAGRMGSVRTAIHQTAPVNLVAADSETVPLPAATTQPQDTPANALIKFCTAMEQNDRAALDDCIYTAQTPERPTMRPAALEEIASLFHLQQLMHKNFGAGLSVPGYGFSDLPASTFTILRSIFKASGDKIQPQGDFASFPWPLSPEIFAGDGPQRDAAAARWKGGLIVLRRVDGNWKLDLDHTFDLVVSVGRKSGNVADNMQIAAQVQRSLDNGFKDLASQIEDGTITSANDADTAAKNVADTAFSDAAVNGESESWLPVIGGEMLSPRTRGTITGILSSLMGGPSTTPASAGATTRPQGQENPVNTLSKLCTALEQNDRAALDDCICDDGVDPAYAALGRAWFHADAAVFRIEKDWSEKFGQGMAVSGLNFDMFPTGTFEIVLRGMLEDPNGLDAKIDGDEAHVRVSLPPTTFTASGPNRFAPMERWSGAMLVLTQTNGVWRLNTDRTANFVISVSRLKGNNDDAIDIEAKVTAGVATTLNDVAAQIEDGRMATAKEARSAIASQIGATFKSAKVNGTNIVALPVIGGTP